MGLFLPFDLKLVSVKLEAFAFSFPTLNFVFYTIVSPYSMIKAVGILL
jgi:hypothetical protein